MGVPGPALPGPGAGRQVSLGPSQDEGVCKPWREGSGLFPSPVPPMPHTRSWEPDHTDNSVANTAAPRPASYSSPGGESYVEGTAFQSRHVKLETKCVCSATLDSHRDEDVPAPSLSPHLPPRTAVWKSSGSTAPRQPAAPLWGGPAALSPASAPALTTCKHTCSQHVHMREGLHPDKATHDTDQPQLLQFTTGDHLDGACAAQDRVHRFNHF